MSRILDQAWVNRLRNAFKTKDEAEFERAMMEPASGATAGAGSEGTGDSHIHLHVGGGRARTGDEPGGEEAGAGGGEGGNIGERLKQLEEQHEEMMSMLDELMGEAEESAEDERVKMMRDRRDKRGYRDETERKKEMDRRSAMDAKRASRRGSRDEGNREIEGDLELEAPPGTTDAKRKDMAKARDSAFLADSFQETLAFAEILAPGIQVPTYDSAADPKATVKTMCALRRRALDYALNRDATRGLVDTQLRGRTLDSMSCAEVRTSFLAAGAAAAALNSNRGSNNGDHGRSYHQVGGGVKSLAELNEQNAAFWKRQ